MKEKAIPAKNYTISASRPVGESFAALVKESGLVRWKVVDRLLKEKLTEWQDVQGMINWWGEK